VVTHSLCRLAWIVGCCAVAVATCESFAAERPPFYQGKTLNFVINFAAGGPTDIESRIFARHLSRHIPGNPSVTIQNMGGGGGLTAVNYLGEVAKPDGYTAAYFTGSLFQHQIKDPALRVDIAKFGFITGVHGVTVSYIRADVPPGIKKPADFVKAQKFRAAGLGVSSSKDVRFRLSFDLLGLKYDYVTGYNNSSDARLAVQRNEAQYHDETLPSYRTQVEPQMVKTGMVMPVYAQSGKYVQHQHDANGSHAAKITSRSDRDSEKSFRFSVERSGLHSRGHRHHAFSTAPGSWRSRRTVVQTSLTGIA